MGPLQDFFVFWPVSPADNIYSSYVSGLVLNLHRQPTAQSHTMGSMADYRRRKNAPLINDISSPLAIEPLWHRRGRPQPAPIHSALPEQDYNYTRYQRLVDAPHHLADLKLWPEEMALILEFVQIGAQILETAFTHSLEASTARDNHTAWSIRYGNVPGSEFPIQPGHRRIVMLYELIRLVKNRKYISGQITDTGHYTINLLHQVEDLLIAHIGREAAASANDHARCILETRARFAKLSMDVVLLDDSALADANAQTPGHQDSVAAIEVIHELMVKYRAVLADGDACGAAWLVFEAEKLYIDVKRFLERMAFLAHRPDSRTSERPRSPDVQTAAHDTWEPYVYRFPVRCRLQPQSEVAGAPAGARAHGAVPPPVVDDPDGEAGGELGLDKVAALETWMRGVTLVETLRE
jgi:hypothetical protein